MLIFISGLMMTGSQPTKEHISLGPASLETSLPMDRRSSFRCNTCNQTFYAKREFRKHMETVHKMMNPPICCSTCSFYCYSQFGLLEHCRDVHKYKCDPCGKLFSSASGWKTHNSINHGKGEKLWICKTCGAKYVTASRLEIHERSHSNSRAFICVTCSKQYKHKKDLNAHICPGSG
ncbi:blast:Zinc finger protein 14 [Mytilus galloprovincialis]|uniref:Blast:Zinc finger protein 14 n=1 Tax=Mytilus galloprovincialis TaxID=29158 RepID=A0A8B6F4L6_MYTGA|nr:blast:Zinc finger protein 14 [Mytilus galloprovincialis]